MPEFSRLILVFLFNLLAAVAAFGGDPAPRIAIVEAADSYVPGPVLGLAGFLDAEGLAYEDLSADFDDSEALDLDGIDLLIVGSFVTNNEAMREAWLAPATGAVLRKFVDDGGVVAILCQADQDLASESWVESPRAIVRADPDYDRAWRTQPDHPLLNHPEEVADDDLRGWRIPEDVGAPRTIWEAFNRWEEGSVILGSVDVPSPPAAGLIEMGWGDGRVLFYAMALDRAFVAGNEAAAAGGEKLLRNLVHYAGAVREGNAPPVAITPTPGYKHSIRGRVFLEDAGEQPLAGVAVSDMLDVVFTDETGAYELSNAAGDAGFVFVHQPGNVRHSGQDFFHRLPDGGDGSESYDFALRQAVGENDSGGGVRFVQLSDSHVRNIDDREYMIEATDEIYAMSPPPDFVVATGDLVDWGVDSQFENYVAGFQAPSIPYFNVFGNHELTLSPGIHLYHHYIGPDYFSFERGGILFLALNPVTPSERQDAWLQRTLEQLGKDRPVVAMQHFPPSTQDLERFAGMGVASVFSGHWHSEKEMEHAGVQSFNTPPFIMGGIDASPAGFKLVHMAPDGTAETEWRYGFQKERLTIVSPPEGSPVGSGYFPILVNAYDTTKNVASVTWRLGTESSPAGEGSLARESAISWIGEHSHPNMSRGSYPLRVEIEDEHGGVWTRDRQVEAILEPPAAPAPGREWPMFMGDGAHTGYTPDTIDELPLRLAWSVDTGGDPDFASPIFADGRIYLGLKKRTRNRTNGVAAFDPVSGKRLWLFETPMAVNHTPAFDGGMLCVAEMGGRVYGVDAATGEPRWHHDLIDDRGRYNYGAPAIHDGRFYAGVMRRIARLRPGDGTLDWERRFGPDNDWISSYGSPAIAGNIVVMGGMFSGDSLVARSIEDNAKLWGHGAHGGMLASATIAGDRVLFGSRHSMLYCLRLSDGEEIWKRGIGRVEEEPTFYSTPMWSATTPAVKMTGDGDGIVVAGSGDGRMRGVNLADGEILWTHVSDESVFKVSPYRRDSRPLLSSPTIAGDKVFFGSADGHLYCLDLESGEELWAYAIGVSVMSTPLVTGNAVYVAAYDGRLYAFTGGTP